MTHESIVATPSAFRKSMYLAQNLFKTSRSLPVREQADNDRSNAAVTMQANAGLVLRVIVALLDRDLLQRPREVYRLSWSTVRSSPFFDAAQTLTNAVHLPNAMLSVALKSSGTVRTTPDGGWSLRTTINTVCTTTSSASKPAQPKAIPDTRLVRRSSIIQTGSPPTNSSSDGTRKEGASRYSYCAKGTSPKLQSQNRTPTLVDAGERGGSGW
jgi:hypothetical protein